MSTHEQAIKEHSETYAEAWGFPAGLAVKNLPAMQETWVQSLGWEDPLEKKTATHSSILAWKTPWTEEPGGIQSMGSQRMTSWTERVGQN